MMKTRSHGFTLLEMIVVIAVIALLLTLLLPAVMSSRAAARRTQCKSNLHQIGVAAQNYESTWEVYAGTPRWQWQLLESLSETEGAHSSPVYGCPSDEYGTGDVFKRQVSYQVNNGLWAEHGNGLAAGIARRQVRARDITDGLSMTAAFAERLAFPDLWPTVVPPNSFQNVWIRRVRNMPAYIADMDAFADACATQPLPPGPSWWGIGNYNHVMTPNLPSCFNGPQEQPEGWNFRAITATSGHPGGVHVLFADGRVTFVSDFVERDTWRALGTRNGKEVVSAP